MITQHEITPENVLSQQHIDWLKHPVTVQMFKNLSKHRETFVKTLAAGAGNSAEPENMFRVHSYGIRTMDAVLSMLKDSTKFVEQSTKQ